MNTHMSANYAQMEAAASQIRGISGALDTQLDNLRDRLQRMTWQGEDRAAYEAHQAKWDSAVREINKLLNEIGGAVGVARSNYITTEKGNAAVWG
ncbi:MAG TPA: WXG100 family type VII secretion target [Micromonosporaceae bacterium]|nr:WXG100 family type VII secretion target [Micromonosporaceae bacterium]